MCFGVSILNEWYHTYPMIVCCGNMWFKAYFIASYCNALVWSQPFSPERISIISWEVLMQFVFGRSSKEMSTVVHFYSFCYFRTKKLKRFENKRLPLMCQWHILVFRIHAFKDCSVKVHRVRRYHYAFSLFVIFVPRRIKALLLGCVTVPESRPLRLDQKFWPFKACQSSAWIKSSMLSP